jgi:hypothetical protein
MAIADMYDVAPTEAFVDAVDDWKTCVDDAYTNYAKEREQ